MKLLSVILTNCLKRIECDYGQHKILENECFLRFTYSRSGKSKMELKDIPEDTVVDNLCLICSLHAHKKSKLKIKEKIIDAILPASLGGWDNSRDTLVQAIFEMIEKR